MKNRLSSLCPIMTVDYESLGNDLLRPLIEAVQ